MTAVLIEAKAIANALGMKCPKPGELVSADRDGVAVTLGLTGVSAKRMPEAAADCVLMAGLAGALDPDLNVGDRVVDDWPEGWPPPAGARRGTIHTASHVAATPTHKADLFAQTSALAVDMENLAVREWARRQGAAFGAIRAISDRADQHLDPAVLTLVDPWGRAKPLAIVQTLLRRPGLIPHLLRLGRDSKAAARRLGECVASLVASATARPLAPHTNGAATMSQNVP